MSNKNVSKNGTDIVAVVYGYDREAELLYTITEPHLVLEAFESAPKDFSGSLSNPAEFYSQFVRGIDDLKLKGCIFTPAKEIPAILKRLK